METCTHHPDANAFIEGQEKSLHAKTSKSSCTSSVVNKFTLTSPLTGVWRIQADAGQNKGAVQTLAEISGSKLEGVDTTKKLYHESPNVFTDNDKIKVKIDKDNIIFIDEKGDDILSVLSWNNEKSYIEFKLEEDEALFGTGERFNGVNQRGKKITVWAEDKWCQKEGNSYLPIPFILSSRNYAILANRFETSLFDLGAKDHGSWNLTQLDAPLDVYIVFGNNPKDIYAKLIKLWGNPALPPAWGWGTLVSRHLNTEEFSSPDGIREMARKMTEHDLPWDAVIIEGWDTFNPETYNDLKVVTAELKKQGKKVLVYEACGRLQEKYWEAQQARPEYFIRDAEGSCNVKEASSFNPLDAPDRRYSCFLDISNPEAVTWWETQVWQPLLKDIGICGAKIDFCEQIPEYKDLSLDSDNPAGLHHRYPVKYNIKMLQLFNKFAEDGGLCWSRGGSIGAHLYPFVWSGDQRREFNFLKSILSAILSSGISGVPFMGHDLGGYVPADNGDNESDVFVRGVQLSCFTATMSTHGNVTRPYDFPSPYLDIYRFYSKIRYLLRPYLQEQAEICVQSGLPLVRHMYLNYPEDSELLKCEDQYMFGDDILVAPVLDDKYSRNITLPAGKWKGLFDCKAYDGKTKLENYPVPLGIIPVFISANSKSVVLDEIVSEIRKLAES